MKQSFIAQAGTTLLLVVTLASQAQPEVREVKWQDLPRGMQTTVVANPVNVHKFTVFQITDINKFLYKVEIKGSVFELETPVPTELQTLFRLNREELEKTVENKKAEEGAALIPEALEPMKGIQAEVTKTLATKEKTREKLSPATADSVVERTDAEIERLRAVAKDLDHLIKVCREYAALADKVAHHILTLKSARSELVSVAQMDKPKEAIMAKVDKIGEPSPSVKRDYLEMKRAYREAEVWYHKVEAYKTDNVLQKAQLKAVETSLEKIEEADEMIDETSLIALFTDVDYLFTELKNENNYNVVSPPVQMDGDLVRYAVKIIPASTRTLGAHKNPMEFAFEVPTRGGLKVDFSVGPAVSFGDNAKDQKFYWEESATQTAATLCQRANNNAVTPSIGALMHAYSRTGKYSGFGGMFGIGAGFQSQESINANFFAGLSYVMGKKQKLMISGGVSYLRVDRLKENEFVVGNQYETGKVKLSDVTEKVYKPSPFLSVSYNLSSRVEMK